MAITGQAPDTRVSGVVHLSDPGRAGPEIGKQFLPITLLTDIDTMSAAGFLSQFPVATFDLDENFRRY